MVQKASRYETRLRRETGNSSFGPLCTALGSGTYTKGRLARGLYPSFDRDRRLDYLQVIGDGKCSTRKARPPDIHRMAGLFGEPKVKVLPLPAFSCCWYP